MILNFSSYWFIVIIILSSNSLLAQKQGQDKIDSLNIVLSKFQPVCEMKCLRDTIKPKVLLHLSAEYSRSNPDTSLGLANEALKLSGVMKWEIGIGLSYLQLGNTKTSKGEFDQAVSYFHHALTQWTQLASIYKGDLKYYVLDKKASTLGNLGTVYNDLGNYKQAMTYVDSAYKLALQINSKENIGNQLGNAGITFMKQGKYKLALQNFNEALTVFIELNDHKKILNQYANMAIVYQEQGLYPKAIEYFLKAKQTAERLNDKKSTGITMSNLGIVYENMKQYDKALEYYNSALLIDRELGNKNGESIRLGLIGVAYFDQAEDLYRKKDSANWETNIQKALLNYTQAVVIAKEKNNIKVEANNIGNIGNVYFVREEYNKALEYYVEALSLFEQMEDVPQIANQLNSIGTAYLRKKNYHLAEVNLNKAFLLFDDIQSWEGIKESASGLVDLYKIKHNYKEALKYTELISRANDTLLNEENIRKIANQELLDYKIKEETKSIMARQELQKQKFLRNSIASGAGIFAVSALISFFFYKHKRDAEQKQKEASLSLQISETEMKALRSQMNPHFVFNALQSIQTFVLSHQSEEANTYLLKFSKLMRAVLENSQHSEVPIEKDVEVLKLYMDLESIRLSHPFTYQFHIDKSINIENDTIPPLILQPFVENSIWHGLQYKDKAGHINIYLAKKDNALYATVEDNGIGRNISTREEQTVMHKKESLGMKLTEERLKILNEIKKIEAQFKITDLFNKENVPAGTRVEMSLPYEIQTD